MEISAAGRVVGVWRCPSCGGATAIAICRRAARDNTWQQSPAMPGHTPVDYFMAWHSYVPVALLLEAYPSTTRLLLAPLSPPTMPRSSNWMGACKYPRTKYQPQLAPTWEEEEEAMAYHMWGWCAGGDGTSHDM